MEDESVQNEQVLQSKCRYCGWTVFVDRPCPHLQISADGQAFIVHSQHQFEPDPYAVLVMGPPPEPEVGPVELAVKARLEEFDASKGTKNAKVKP